MDSMHMRIRLMIAQQWATDPILLRSAAWEQWNLGRMHLHNINIVTLHNKQHFNSFFTLRLVAVITFTQKSIHKVCTGGLSPLLMSFSSFSCCFLTKGIRSISERTPLLLVHTSLTERDIANHFAPQKPPIHQQLKFRLNSASPGSRLQNPLQRLTVTLPFIINPVRSDLPIVLIKSQSPSRFPRKHGQLIPERLFPADTDNQRVIIHVRDVNDEPPYFINRPLPMQAVVQLNAPPNTPVFTLQARDPDTDHNIHYFIVRDRTGGRFEVDERSGVVRTRGTDVFQLDMEYVLYVKAEDQNGRVDERRFQSTPEERLSIVGGKRAPQFYMPSYEAEIPENQKKDSDIISVKAKSFADREIRYTLKAQGQGAGTFNIGPTSGIVKLAKELDFEDLRQPHVYSLVVTATEDSGGFSTSVELTIRVTDVNDNAPKFELPDYQAHNVDEDIPPGTSILKVKAMDADSGANAEIEYLVSDDHFSVDPSGIISNNKQLDADNNNAYYEFVVTAKDKGEPAKTGTATVRVYTKNKNDEEPKFSQQVYTPNVDENAGPNTLVTTVVASDKDGDNVRFGFVGGGTSSGQFVIEEITGVIRLHSKSISLDRDKYELNVTAMDDGACCVNGDQTIHTSTAVVVVFITDVNDNKPIFKDCGTYYPKVEEGAPNGSPVIKVQATDEDKGVNGQVKYSIVQQPNQKGTKFTVNEETGEVSTNKVFDREGDDGKFVSVTVKATDQGEPSLEGVCSFTVEITDVNDNPPLFDRQKYVENVKQDASIGTNILRVSASDEDADNNGAIVYTLNAGSNAADLEYFEIQPESGWIVLKKALDRDRYRLRVRASDRGEPPSYADVDVELDVVDRNNKPPVWDVSSYGPIHIRENVTVGTVVTSVKARLVSPAPTWAPQAPARGLLHHHPPFRGAPLTVGVMFPAAQRETYKLEATAQDKGYPPLSRSVEVQIDVVDRANNPPIWDHVVYGPIFIRENLPVGAKVVSAKARSVPPSHPVSVNVRPVQQHELHGTISSVCARFTRFNESQHALLLTPPEKIHHREIINIARTNRNELSQATHCTHLI
ncbi:hypothetical protein Zmor_013053 [Zophobas morio]|uniref:Cadherin domain-containing protein n=1 Tax=Zophobas morio TaxID=2755281 RepID=A0AA38IEU5_9CUCU|nr:hypothetical protein Zmor_013053 [Zophobas morio]